MILGLGLNMGPGREDNPGNGSKNMSLIRANEILCHKFLAVQTATPTATRITAMIAVTMSMTRLLVVADRASHADFSQFSQEWETRSTPETPGMSFSLSS